MSEVLLKKINHLSQILNPSFEMNPSWDNRVCDLESSVRNDFLEQVIKVLQAECDKSFFRTGHFEKTLTEKPLLSHYLSVLITDLLADIFPQRVSLSGYSKFFGNFDETAIKSATNSIREKGYCIWPALLSPSAINVLRDDLCGSKYRSRMTGKVIHGKDLAIMAETSDETLQGVWWVEQPKNLVKCLGLQDIAFDPFILAIAQMGLGAAPIHVQTNSWWSFPPYSNKRKNQTNSNMRAEFKNAQRFHQDQEFITFLKVFIYLSDVGEKNGPHIYVEGSANDYEDLIEIKQSSDRQDDRDIERIFGKERVKSITGPKGQVAFVNTRGFHKGASVKEGYRLILQLEYASSLYFNPIEAFDISAIAQKYSGLQKAVPRIFANYRIVSKHSGKSSKGLLRRCKQKFNYIRGRIEEFIA